MKYTKTLVAALMALTLFTTVAPAATNAVTETAKTSEWVVSLAGSGATSLSGTANTGIGADVSIGHTGTLVLPVEGGVRQKFAYNSGDMTYGTKAYLDVTVFRFKSLELQAGGNVGVSYGNTPLAWTVSPEVTGRLWLKKDVFSFARAEYPFDLNPLKAKKSLVYTLGIGFTF
jgi:hypothetical protein